MRRLLLIGLLCLAACSSQDLIDKIATPREQALALQIIDQVRAGQTDALIQGSVPELRPQLPGAMKQILPVIAPVRGPFHIVSVNKMAVAGGPTTTVFNAEGGSGNRWAVARVTIQQSGATQQLAGFYVTPFAMSPSQAGDFRIGQRGPIGYLWIAVMLASFATCIAAIILIWRRRWIERRWLWTIASLIGIGQFALDWSSGAWELRPVYIGLLGAAALRAGPYAPWVLSFSIPIGALIVILRWYRRDPNADEYDRA